MRPCCLSDRAVYPPLTHAILSGERSVQFAALDAINQLDPKQAFPGSSHVVTLAVYLAGGSGQPVALIGHHRVGRWSNLCRIDCIVGLAW